MFDVIYLCRDDIHSKDRDGVIAILDGKIISADTEILVADIPANHYTWPGPITSIGDGAFFGCRYMTGINIPNTVTTIGNYAFWGCKSQTNLIIPDSVTSIGDGAFWNCGNLTSVTLPDHELTHVGDDVFGRATSPLGVGSFRTPTRSSLTRENLWEIGGVGLSVYAYSGIGA